MRKWLLLLIIGFASMQIFAQAPLGFNYQGIARQADGTPISGQDIGVKISIVDGPQGSSQFVEEHFLQTNDFGLFTAVVGQGSGNSTLNSVDWAQGNLWLQIELDPDNSGKYILMGSQQLMSVPYALFAQQSGEGLAPGYGISVNEGTISNVLPDRPISITGSGNVQVTGEYPNFNVESSGSADADADPTNEIQDLKLVGNVLTVTNNGTATDIDLTSYLDNTDTQLTEAEVDDFANNNGYLTAEVDGSISNEIQDLQLVGNILTITNNGTATDINLTPFLDDTNTQLSEAEVDAYVANDNYLQIEVDGDATNELQTISKSGSTVTLSNSGGSFTDEVDDADADLTNEIQDLQLVGNILTISDNGTATAIDLSPYLDDTDTQLTEAEVDGFVGNNGYLTAEVDGSISNEIQDLQLVGNILTITNNGTASDIDLTPYLDNSDTQLTEAEVDAFANDNGYLTAEVDGSVSNEIQDLQLVGNILTITNNGTASDIDLTPYLDNSDTQLTEAEVDAFANDNGYLTAEADGSVSNEIQDLQLVGNILTITNNGTATDIDLTPYLDNTNTQLTEAEVDGFAGNNGYLTAEVDGSILNEIQNLSADAPVGTNRTINISGGTSTTISIADNDNSTSNETISTTSYETNNTIRFVEGAVNKDLYIGTLNADLDADNNKIINVANPVNAQDAVNLQFLEAKDATDYAINASINYFNPSGTWEIFGFSGVSLDKGNLISGGVITISEAGVYSVSVQGFSALSVGSDIDILINGLSGSATPVLRSVNIYIGTYLFDLSIGDTILLYYKSSGPAESISLQTSIFKI